MVKWAKEANQFSESMEAFLKALETDEESFAKLSKHEQHKIKSVSDPKKLVNLYNHMIDASNNIQYSKEFH